ncbi:MAG: CbiX/SirB N-terminal domain-containing protein [Bryobacteraceae bacterium]|jgi:sirohydrochlorin ferrochelatase
MTALVVFAHGSTVAAANQAIHDVAARVQTRSGYITEAAFLEIAEPDLPRAVATLVKRGASRIVVLPYFLAPGKHAERDLPRIIEQIRGIHKEVRIEAAANLDGHPALVGILLDRAAAVLEEL